MVSDQVEFELGVHSLELFLGGCRVEELWDIQGMALANICKLELVYQGDIGVMGYHTENE